MSDRRESLKRVIVDLNTQADFLLPNGAFPVSNRATMLPAIQCLMQWARAQGVPVISSLEAHRASEFQRGLPPHCIDRSRGQQKVPCTLMPRRVLVQGDNTFDLPADPFRRFQQIIFTKRDADFLSNPKADRLINAQRPHYWIISGVAATHSVKSLTLGLLARNFRVVVARDASGFWSPTDGEHAFRQMEAKGAILATVDELVAGLTDQLIAERISAEQGLSEKPEIELSAHVRALREKRQARSSEKAKPTVTDFVPQHLIRKETSANGKPGSGLA